MICKRTLKYAYPGLILILFLLLAGVNASGQQLETKISVHLDSGRLDKVLLQLQQAVGFRVAYESSGLHQLSVQAKSYKNQKLKNVLGDLLKNTGYTFEDQHNTIIIGPGDDPVKTKLFEGVIEDKETGEKLQGVAIYDPNNRYTNTFTDQNGYFSLPAVADTLQLTLKYLGYAPALVVLYASEAPVVRIKMAVKQTELDSVIIIPPQDIVPVSALNKVAAPHGVNFLPGFNGNMDLLNMIRITSGIVEANDGSGNLIVRGGAPDQNLLLLDGANIYSTTHLFGLLSSVNADAVKDISLYKGAFPARFGGRISSVWDIVLKNGDSETFHGKVTAGTMASDFMIEGPIVKSKTSFMISGRRSYHDYYLRQSVPGIKLYFQDLDLKLCHRFSNKDNLSFTWYTSKDYFRLDNDSTYSNFQLQDRLSLLTKNNAATLNWSHLFSDHLDLNLSAVYSGFSLQVKNEVGSFPFDNSMPWLKRVETIENGLHDLSGKLQIRYAPAGNHSLEAGMYATRHVFNPANFTLAYTSSDTFFFPPTILKDSIIDKPAFETSFFVEDRVTLWHTLGLSAGVHANNYTYGDRSYFYIQPRINVRYKLGRRCFAYAAYVRMQQNLHRLSISQTSLPVDFWIPSTETIRPQLSDQFNLGISGKTWNDRLELNLESYYKTIRNVSEYLALPDSGATESNGWASKITSGKGACYGLEISAGKSKGNLKAWLSYALSWSTRTLPEINNGMSFPYKYDRRHNLNLAGTYTLGKHFEFSAVFNFQSRQQPPVLIIRSNNQTAAATQLKDAAASVKLNAYHRLDIGAGYHIQYTQKLRATWSLSILNVYNRKNYFYYFYNDNNQLSGISLLPLLVSLSHTFIF